VDTVGGGAEGRGGEDGDAMGLDGADDEHLVGSGEVGVDNIEATKGRHSGDHGALGDGVHRGGEDQGEERNPAHEMRGEGDVVGGEVNVVWEKDDVIVGVGVAMVEELGGGEPILLHCCAALGFWVTFPFCIYISLRAKKKIVSLSDPITVQYLIVVMGHCLFKLGQPVTKQRGRKRLKAGFGWWWSSGRAFATL
jgi:hypothetical protein